MADELEQKSSLKNDDVDREYEGDDNDLGEEDEDLDDDELSHDEAEERYLAILNAATEITSAAVSNAGAQALKDPDQVAALFTKVFDAIVNL